jgi:hypothetical protein
MNDPRNAHEKYARIDLVLHVLTFGLIILVADLLLSLAW